MLISAKNSGMQRATRDHISIRDSIHGSIVLNARELELIDHPALQRLRAIRQAGFIDLAFPGANHTRYAHSLGAMHMATRIFDNLFTAEHPLQGETRELFRQSLRLASLCHDIGHGPYSHSSEALMPKLAALGFEKAMLLGNVDRQATHEDYTLKLLVDSAFSHELIRLFSAMGLTKRHIVDLIFRELDSSLFIHEGINYRPVLQQIVSSECDADRMDYLQRDSIYCGVNYGKFDADWLVENLYPVTKNDAVYLGIQSKAIFSFEDFLLSRYHMFASVYFHHTPVVFDRMLELHFRQNEQFQLPADIEAYIQIDDIELWSHLRKSKCQWAKRIVERKPFYLLDEYKIDSESVTLPPADHDAIIQKLDIEGIQTIRSCSKSLLSKYFGKEASSIFVITNSNTIVPIESYTPLYQRYRAPAELHRLFVDPEHKTKAWDILKAMR